MTTTYFKMVIKEDADDFGKYNIISNTHNIYEVDYNIHNMCSTIRGCTTLNQNLMLFVLN